MQFLPRRPFFMYKDKKKQKKFQQDHYKKNKDKVSERSKNRRKERKAWFKEITYGIKCKYCGENDPACMDFHHRDPKTKIGEVTKLLNEFRSKEIVLQEIEKCDILCANCHRKYHYYDE